MLTTDQTSGEAATEFHEPLAASAKLALDWSQSLCRQEGGEGRDPGCAWYHGSWQMLRLLGLFHSIRSDDDFFLAGLQQEIEAGARRILVSGAADYALQARIMAAAGSNRRAIKLTVLDRCATPLKLNAWYAAQLGMKIETVQNDVLCYQPAEPFDLVCTHSFLCFFDAESRVRLIGNWYDMLAPGGAVMTAQRVRCADREAIISYNNAQIASLVQTARDLAVTAGAAHEITPELAGHLARGYATHHWTHLIGSVRELRTPFEECGYVLETFEPPGATQHVLDVPGTPNPQGSQRWRILARKPAVAAPKCQ